MKIIAVTPAASIEPNVLRLRNATIIPEASSARIKPEQQQAADEAELLGQHGEDEIGVFLRQEIKLVLRALQVALADQPARTDGDHRLQDVIAGAQRILRRIEERQDAPLLVIVHEMPRQRRCRHGADGQRDEIAPLHAGQETHDGADYA